MINKELYIEILSQILNEYYNEIKQKGIASKERQQFIDGYLTAARALDALFNKELKVIIDKIHLKAFGKTLEERKRSESSKTSLDNEFLKIPTYVRDGISLGKK